MAAAMEIADLVRDNVDPDNWRACGGLVSSISVVGSSLTINTSRRNHNAIFALFNQWRDAHGTEPHECPRVSESEADISVKRALVNEIPVKFEGNRLENVFEFLRNVGAIPICVNWRALEGAGIEPGTSVTLNVTGSVASVIELVLAYVGGDLVPLDFDVEDGTILVTTAEDFSRHTHILSYNVSDLEEIITVSSESQNSEVSSEATEVGDMTIGALIKCLKPGMFWKCCVTIVGTHIVAFLLGIALGKYEVVSKILKFLSEFF